MIKKYIKTEMVKITYQHVSKEQNKFQHLHNLSNAHILAGFEEYLKCVKGPPSTLFLSSVQVHDKLFWGVG